jgi:hypothetical protein
MTDKQSEALIRAEELEQIGAESSLARAMAAHTIRLLYKENEAIRARLAQPEQEPVAWGVPNTRPTEKAQFMMLLHSPDGCQYPEQLVPLYTAPPQREWQGLTDDEIKEIVGPWGSLPIDGYTRKLFDQIEAKLKDKNHE